MRKKSLTYSNENALKTLRKKCRVSLSVQAEEVKKRVAVYGTELAYLCFTGIVAAFIGWAAENAVKLFSSGVIDSRFHLLPFISPYALVPFALHILLGDPDDLTVFGKKVFAVSNKKSKIVSNVISFVTICLTVFLGELTVGNVWEMLFGVRLWDYSAQPLHLTRYVSLFSALGYGAGAYLLFKFALKPFTSALRKHLSYDVAVNVCLTLGVLIVLDTLIMCAVIAFTGSAPVYWSLSI